MGNPVARVGVGGAGLLPLVLGLWVNASEPSAPTYCKDVAPILQAKCQGCHRTGQVGPFPLMTYPEAKRWSTSIVEVLEERRMPPWHADPAHGKFSNDRSLSEEEKKTLLSWVAGGAAEGELKDLPPERKFPEGPWTIGAPDVVLSMPRPFKVKAEGTLPYQWFSVPTNFQEDRWVQAIEVKPGNRSVVHHILIFVTEGEADSRPEGNRPRGDAGDGQLTGYVPGDEATVFPVGMGKKIPKGASLQFQVHYTPIGKPVEDQSSVAMIFAKETPTQEVRTVGIVGRPLEIPAGASNHEVRAEVTAPAEATVLSLWPHMHLRGKDFRFTARYPDGREEILLSVPHYDFNWQSTYVLAEPKKVPKGTVVSCVAHFDNSAANPNNPDPTQAVRWGPQTDDEMMIGYVDFVSDQPRGGLGGGAGSRLGALRERLGIGRGRAAGRGLGAGAGAGAAAGTPEERTDRAFQTLDRDKNGVIDREELATPALFNAFDSDGDGKITRQESINGFKRLPQRGGE